MRRRGQIFLILTILVITFMIAISSVLLDIQRANYYEPAPESNTTFNAWQNTVSALEQIVEIQLSQNTVNVDPNNTIVDISNQVNRLETYLTERGLTASISITNTPEYIINTVGSTLVSYSISIDFDIVLSSSKTDIEQSMTIDLTYQVEDVGTELIVTRNLNGEITFISGASVTPILTDMGNGAYDGETPNTYTIVTPKNIVLSITTT